MYDFDVVVLGAGPGGYPAAIRAAQLGLKAAIVERDALGGTCLNCGCIPTKALISSSELYRRAKGAASLGVEISGLSFDYARMIERKDGIVARLSGGVGTLLKANGVEVVTGVGRLEDPHTVSVKQPDATTRWLRAKTIILATGSESAMPGFLPRHERVVESKAFLERKTLPASMLVLGGGVIGCELACMAASLGTKVTLVELLEDILMPLDGDTRRVLRKQMEELGMTILTGAPMSGIAATGKGVTAKFKDQPLSADLLLVAVGRRPNTAELGLARAGIEADERGYIPVDCHCRTRTASVFAVGDIVAGGIQLAHAATMEGIVAAECAAGRRTKMDPIIPSCIFTTPEIGIVGLSETQAKAQGRAVKAGVFPFLALGKAVAMGETDGFVKWIADATTGQLLGAQAVGPHATELVSEATVAIRHELTAEALANTVHCHPTLGESWMEAAHAVEGTCINMPPRRR
ncbi:MAG: dihydrolipoyl dehydrogenase [Kiritimatiellia bacterium]|jgi:dihydrolipoamide dehydrogenase